jgi:hypothetical protein
MPGDPFANEGRGIRCRHDHTRARLAPFGPTLWASNVRPPTA